LKISNGGIIEGVSAKKLTVITEIMTVIIFVTYVLGRNYRVAKNQNVFWQ
jgi:hypothetical protein